MLLAQAGGGQVLTSSLMMFAIVGLVFYFMLIRPQKKQQKEFAKTMDNLKVGDQIITRGGIRGTIVEITGDAIVIESANSTRIELLKQALSYVESDPQSNSHLNRTPVGRLDYGKDERFINKLEELKAKDDKNEEYDLLLVDIFEFVVVEDAPNIDSISNKFRLPEDRAEEIMTQLEDLGILSKGLLKDDREILVDPRK